MIKKSQGFLNEKKTTKKTKKTKRVHAFKDFASSYNVKILNYFNCELQLKIKNLELKIN